MLDEVVFAQTRLFRIFCTRTGLSPQDGNSLWSRFDIWDFVEACYDSLHMSGDDAALEDIFAVLRFKGAAL